MVVFRKANTKGNFATGHLELRERQTMQDMTD